MDRKSKEAKRGEIDVGQKERSGEEWVDKSLCGGALGEGRA